MDTLFERKLAARLDEMRDSARDAVTHTVLPQADYAVQIGYLKCLSVVMEICDEIRSEIQKG